MPRKKQTENSLSGPVSSSSPPARIHCPACKSEISGDGATLHARSKYLEDLLETDADVEKLEKIVAGLEEKLTAAKQALEQEKAKAATQTKPEARENVGKEKPKRDSTSWW